MKLYFSQAEVISMLEDYCDKCKIYNHERIDYNVWRKLKSAPYGIWIKITSIENGEYDLKFYEADIDTDRLFCFINEARFTTCHDFGNFIFNKYCKNHFGFINETNEINEELKEKDNMNGFNFNFGPCTNDNVRMSMYGLAVKNQNDEWVSYNTATKQIVNVDILNFDGRKFMFKMPVAIKDIAIGDIIIHNKVPMFVTAIGNENEAIVAVDVRAGEEKKILPTTSPFGFNFVTKIISMFAAFENSPTPDTPFGNFLPFMMMSNEKDNNEIDPIMMMMLMQQNSNVFNNPMMLYFLCGDKAKENWMLPFMLMNNNTISNK